MTERRGGGLWCGPGLVGGLGGRQGQERYFTSTAWRRGEQVRAQSMGFVKIVWRLLGGDGIGDFCSCVGWGGRMVSQSVSDPQENGGRCGRGGGGGENDTQATKGDMGGGRWVERRGGVLLGRLRWIVGGGGWDEQKKAGRD